MTSKSRNKGISRRGFLKASAAPPRLLGGAQANFRRRLSRKAAGPEVKRQARLHRA
jgi:hypothetical protein